MDLHSTTDDFIGKFVFDHIYSSFNPLSESGFAEFYEDQVDIIFLNVIYNFLTYFLN